MKCPNCNTGMCQLFTSWVCDNCNPPAASTMIEPEPTKAVEEETVSDEELEWWLASNNMWPVITLYEMNRFVEYVNKTYPNYYIQVTVNQPQHQLFYTDVELFAHDPLTGKIVKLLKETRGPGSSFNPTVDDILFIIKNKP